MVKRVIKVRAKEMAKKEITKRAKKRKSSTKILQKETLSSPILPTLVEFRHEKYNPQHFFNRDLSWLDFNLRVLNEAMDQRTPLLERLRFMNIWRSNNDEFSMKRVGSLLRKMKEGRNYSLLSGHAPEELFREMRKKIDYQKSLLSENFEKDLRGALEEEGIKILSWKELSVQDALTMKEYFRKNIFPILTPLAAGPEHPFPFLSNLSKSIGVCLRKPREEALQFARLKIPSEIPQWMRLKKNRTHEHRFINIEEVITANLEDLFTGMVIESSCLFRITRNASISEEGDDIEDKLEWVEEGLRERKFAPVVRLEIREGASAWMINFLMTELELDERNLSLIDSLPLYADLGELVALNRKRLKYKSYPPQIPEKFDPSSPTDFNLFSAIRKRDILVHYPYESFSHSLEAMVKAAAIDPKVLAIKIILYRTDTDGLLIDALIQAAENKKQVACIIELKARFDEERNIHWAQTLEDAGIHVSYGLIEKKTHAKMLLIVRKDPHAIRSYVNIGTGNYNPQTSRLYTDYGLFTCRKEICDEVVEVFNYLTGRSQKKDYKHLLVAPYTMFDRFIHMISQETTNAREGKIGRIIAKMNQLEDPKIIEALYEASQAGVKITLFIRGFCSLKPKVTGLSENIEVFSLVGRLLEHSRLYYFRNGQRTPRDGLFFMGSADWMYRNLFDRVEVITPILQRDLKQSLWTYLRLLKKDNRHLWELKSDGTYVQRRPLEVGKKKREFNSQLLLLKGRQ